MLCFPNLHGSVDEGTAVGSDRDKLLFGGRPWLEKPPLVHWLVMLAGWVAGGVDEAVARQRRALRRLEVLSGREIAVEFDRPTPLQIDGETVPDVTAYRAVAFAQEAAEAANA